MSSKNGGPAFPEQIAVTPTGDTYSGEQGMSLRDYFAAKVLPVMIADGEALEAVKMMAKKMRSDPIEITATACYLYADAMLKARNE